MDRPVHPDPSMAYSDDPGRASGALRRSRYRRVEPWLRGDLLEIGCATSDLPGSLPAAVTSYSGCDLDSLAIERLSQEHPEHSFAVVDLDAGGFPADFGPFDTVLAAAVIEHLFNLRSVMERVVSVLKPGGRVVMTTPTPIGNDVVLPLTARFGITSRNAHDDHINILNRKRFGLLAREVGLELVRYRYFQGGLNSLAVMEPPGSGGSGPAAQREGEG